MNPPDTTETPVKTAEKRAKTQAKLDQLRDLREQRKAGSSARSVAMQSWVVPLLLFAANIALVLVLHDNRPVWIAFVNIAVILYSATCSVRTWINVARRGATGLLVPGIIGSLINLLLLAGIAAIMKAMYFSGGNF